MIEARGSESGREGSRAGRSAAEIRVTLPHIGEAFPLAHNARSRPLAPATKELHDVGGISLYASALIVKDRDGGIIVKQHSGEAPLGTGLGLLVGGIVGILGGPAGAAVGASLGGSFG
jgi:hypothetical protein